MYKPIEDTRKELEDSNLFTSDQIDTVIDVVELLKKVIQTRYAGRLDYSHFLDKRFDYWDKQGFSTEQRDIVINIETDIFFRKSFSELPLSFLIKYESMPLFAGISFFLFVVFLLCLCAGVTP